MARTTPQRHHPTGFTLIELIVAFAIALLITSTAVLIFNLYFRSLLRQQLWRSNHQPAAAMLDNLQRDITTAVYGAGMPSTRFVVRTPEPAEHIAMELALATAQAGNDKPSTAPPIRLTRVTYNLRDSNSNDGNMILHRIALPLSTDSSAGSAINEHIDGVTRVELMLFDGRTWTNRWDSNTRHALPQAARINLGFKDSDHRESMLTTTCLIPAGITLRPGDSARANR